jgi:RNA polymerase sigma-70 factor (TIGR02954 family)
MVRKQKGERKLENEILLAKAQRGDDEAFFLLISSNKEQLYRIAYSYLKSESDALEAIQEVTFRVYKGIKKLKEASYFKTWLIRIMINYCIDEQRKRKRLVFTEKEVATTSEDSTTNIAMQDAVYKLKANYQKVIVLKYYEDLTVQQIASVLEKPEGTIKTWLHKALKQLKAILEKEGEKFYV